MIAIIDYNAGNIASVKNAIERLGFKCKITSRPKEILKAEKVIFPGQGRAGSSMKLLREKGLDKAIKEIKAPFLGICLGMQLLADFCEEDSTQGLSIIKGEVVKFPPNLKAPQIGWNKVFLTKKSPLTEGIEDGDYFYFVNSYYFKPDGTPAKCPFDCNLQFSAPNDSSLFAVSSSDTATSRLAVFARELQVSLPKSHFAGVPDINSEIAYTNYGLPFTSIVNKNNFYGVQFHPEKSGKAGEKLLNNFLNL